MGRPSYAASRLARLLGGEFGESLLRACQLFNVVGLEERAPTIVLCDRDADERDFPGAAGARSERAADGNVDVSVGSHVVGMQLRVGCEFDDAALEVDERVAVDGPPACGPEVDE